jgi:monoterpene epsilon-lactone hydrolase
MISWQAQTMKAYLRLQRIVSPPRRDLDVTKDRADLVAMARLFRPMGKVDCQPVDAAGLLAEWIVPAGLTNGRTILYLHGGSFNAGSIETHRALAANLALAVNARTLLIDYRLAPEHPFPAALQDAVAAYEWLIARPTAPGNLILAGDSAGGGLVLSLLLDLRDRRRPLPAMGVCLSPATDLTMSGASMRTNANATADLVLETRNIRQSVEIYLRGTDPRNPLASPMLADLGGLPALLLQVGSDEMLLSDSTEFAARAGAAGVKVSLQVWPHMQHVWQFAASFVPEGRQAIRDIAQFVERNISA